MANDPDYTAVAWGESHYYTLDDGNLIYRFETSDAVYSFDLTAGNFTLQADWQTHRLFRAGLGLLLFPLLPLGAIYAKEHTFANVGPFLYLLVGLMVAGLVMALRYRTIYRTHVLTTANGDQILIIHYPNDLTGADAFITRVKAFLSQSQK